jgi:hypothetical protein
MQEIYLTVDWERDLFNISQAVFNSPMPKTDIVTILPQNASHLISTTPQSKKLSVGAISGIAVACVLLLVAIVLSVWFYRRKRRTLETSSADEPSEAKSDTAEFAPEVAGSDKKPGVRMDAELEGRLVPEMYAPLPPAQKYAQVSEMEAGRGESRVEAEGSAMVYELAGTEATRGK